MIIFFTDDSLRDTGVSIRSAIAVFLGIIANPKLAQNVSKS